MSYYIVVQPAALGIKCAKHFALQKSIGKTRQQNYIYSILYLAATDICYTTKLNQNAMQGSLNEHGLPSGKQPPEQENMSPHTLLYYVKCGSRVIPLFKKSQAIRGPRLHTDAASLPLWHKRPKQSTHARKPAGPDSPRRTRTPSEERTHPAHWCLCSPPLWCSLGAPGPPSVGASSSSPPPRPPLVPLSGLA